MSRIATCDPVSTIRSSSASIITCVRALSGSRSWLRQDPFHCDKLASKLEQFRLLAGDHFSRACWHVETVSSPQL
jgi:hypothetical protein